RPSVTSAALRAGRETVPAKITSSIAPPRMLRAEVSPMTQVRASTRFDLPHPLGPTMPVSPSLISSSVGSTNDLKPDRRKWEHFIASPYHARYLRVFRSSSITSELRLPSYFSP